VAPGRKGLAGTHDANVDKTLLSRVGRGVRRQIDRARFSANA